MSLEQNHITKSSTTITESKHSNTISGTAYMLGLSPDSLAALLAGGEAERIKQLEKERQDLTNTVQRLMRDRERVMNGIKELFSKIQG